MPEISVIVPVYKVEQYLRKCIDSILTQSFKDYELILVDDGSSDQCGAICDSYANDYPSVHVIHQENQGLSAARNAGISWSLGNSDSEWIAFVDSDDYLHPDYLSTLFEKCTHNRCDIAMCDFLRVDELGNCVDDEHDYPNRVVTDKNEFFNILYSNWRTVVAWNKLYRKTLFEHVRYDVGKLHEDEFIIHKLLGQCSRICYMSDQLYMYVIRSGSIMTSEKEINNRLISWEAWIGRYWYCKSNGYPINDAIISIDYMLQILGMHDEVPADRKSDYLAICNKYKEMLLDASKNPMKVRLALLLNKLRNR